MRATPAGAPLGGGEGVRNFNFNGRQDRRLACASLFWCLLKMVGAVTETLLRRLSSAGGWAGRPPAHNEHAQAGRPPRREAEDDAQRVASISCAPPRPPLQSARHLIIYDFAVCTFLLVRINGTEAAPQPSSLLFVKKNRVARRHGAAMLD